MERFTLLYRKFIQDNAHQILLESTAFCGRYDKNILVCFMFTVYIAYKPKNAKVGQTGRGLRRVTYFYNFCTPTTSIERLKLQTSNLVHTLTLITRGTIQKYKN